MLPIWNMEVSKHKNKLQQKQHSLLLNLLFSFYCVSFEPQPVPDPNCLFSSNGNAKGGDSKMNVIR